MKTPLLAILGALAVVAANVVRAAEVSEVDLIPFVLPWDDGARGPTNMSFLNHVPAGKSGPIRAGGDGHLYAGRERVRFLGVNVCFAANVPAKADAAKIAARMARFGINVVRFHHTDTGRFPNGLILRNGERSGDLDPEALDRMDYFLAALKKHGIYADINLLVGRRFCAADGLPAEIDNVDWKLRHTIAMFHPAMIELQKRYARDLLRHRNAYTRLTYAEDPATAFVEINNENGLIQNWLGGRLDDLPGPFTRELARQWNEWLKRRYANTGRLRQTWRSRSEPPGAEMLATLDTVGRAGPPRWNLERHGEAVASLKLQTRSEGQGASLQITVAKPGKEAWHVQLNHRGLQVKANSLYTLVFRAKADRDRSIDVSLGQAHDPWHPLGFSTTVNLGTRWREYRYTLVASADDDNARINFTGLGRVAGSVWIAGASLRPGGVEGLADSESIETGAVPIVRRNGTRPWSTEAQDDFVRFLWDTERSYWKTTREFVKNDLGFRGIVVGTIVGCSTPNVQAVFDAVDGHAYWKHPHFPGKPWDREDWTVGNQSMVNEAGGTLAGLSMQRVAGKPFTVSEYNHAAPNTYSSEAPLLLAAHGAFQDWDAVFLFAYNHSGRWDSRKIPNFFDIDQHPTKMANLPVAALLFRAAHVWPATETVVSGLDAQEEPDLIRRRGRSWKQADHELLGLSPAVSLLHRTALRFGSEMHQPRRADVAPPSDAAYLVSDTGEIAWDRRRANKGVVTINTPRTKGVIGFADGRSFVLGDVTITPGPTIQDWSTICLSLMEGQSFAAPARAIIVATGYAQNTGMKWKNPERSSVGSNWGDAPSLVEAIPARIRVPAPPRRIEVWSLDEGGQRAERIAPEPDANGGSIIPLGRQKTLWYELRIQ